MNEENERLASLYSYNIIDSLPEAEYDEIVKIAAAICNMPVALISLVDKDRQWFKAAYSYTIKEISRDISFCSHAINTPYTPMIVTDARRDKRFHNNPLVVGEKGIVFYAGFPFVTDEGFALGTLCVIDYQQNELSDNQHEALKALANQVGRLLELRKIKSELNISNIALQAKNNDLDQFAKIAAHDLKAPLANISSLIDVLLRYYSHNLNDNVIEMLDLISNSSQQLRNLIDGILNYSRNQKVLSTDKETVFLPQFFKGILNLIDPHSQYEINFKSEDVEIKLVKPALQQILINLISNAIRYNDKPDVKIDINFKEELGFYHFSVADNGVGIIPDNLEKIFNIFEVCETEDRFGERGSGVGLTTVRRLIHGLGGAVDVESVVGKGSTFLFKIPK